MPIHKKNQTAGRTLVQSTLIQQSFIQATLPFAAPEITPQIAPSSLSNALPKKNSSQSLSRERTHKEKRKSATKSLKTSSKTLIDHLQAKNEPNQTAELKVAHTLKTELKKEPTVSGPEKPEIKQTKGPSQAYTDLLKHPQLWRGKDLTKASITRTVASGYSALDDCLAGGGWPNAGLVDFILPHAGIGELRLLLPALTTLAENRWLAWINPPFTPYAPALEAAGIDSSKILLIYAKSHEEMLWAMERTCKSGSCGAVLVWPDERKLSLKETRRVQLAAKQGTTLSVLFRPIEATSKASLAELRLGLSPGKDPLHLSVDIIKRRGGWPVKGLTLPIAAVTQSQYTSANAVRQKLSLWREQRAGVQFQQEALQETLKEQGDNNDFTKMGSEDSSKNSSKDYVKSYAEGFSEGNTGNTSAPSLH